jgi:hypothetical protein
VRTGELILSTGVLPDKDIFSNSANGAQWIVQGWLADVVLASVWSETGIWGVRALVSAMLVGVYWVVLKTVSMYVRDEAATVLAVCAIALVTVGLAPRQTMATFLFLALVLRALLRFRMSGRVLSLAPLPFLFALWPNLHFGFVTGFGIAALFLAADVLDKVKPFDGYRAEKGSLLSVWGIAIGALCVLAIALNPHGLSLLSYIPGKFLDDATSPISEWQTPSFHGSVGKLVYFSIVAFLVVRTWARGPVSWLDLLVPSAMIGAGLAAGRHVPLMGIVLYAFIARALAQSVGPVFSTTGAHGGAGFASALSRDLGERASAIVNWILVAITAAAVIGFGDKVDAHFRERERLLQPAGAADFVLANKLEGRIFNTYNGGGYLLNRLFPQQRVFIDGRFNPYPRVVVDDYFEITSGNTRWRETFDKYDFEVAICESDSPFRQLLIQRPDFRLVFDDAYFSVLVRDTAATASLRTIEPKGRPQPDAR